MGSNISKAALDELVGGILNAVPEGISRIILYGSAARGTAEPDSDVDVAVILTRPFTHAEEDMLTDLITDMDLKYDKVFSVIDVNGDDYRKWQEVLPFYRNVEREGVVLWQAA